MREDEGGRQWDARTSKRWYAGTFMRANDHARFVRFWAVKVLSFVMASSAMSEKRWPVVGCRCFASDQAVLHRFCALNSDIRFEASSTTALKIWKRWASGMGRWAATHARLERWRAWN